MPRVSLAHTEARRSQILEAARVCFLRKGFHETSMQDIFREAGLSAGAVYLYFKSKDELITTLAADRLQTVAAGIERLTVAGELPPLEQLAERVIRSFLTANGGMDFERLAIQIISESQYNPALTALTDTIFGMMLGLIIRVVDAYKSRALIDADIPSEAVARVIASVVHGFLVQRSLDPSLDPELFLTGLQAFRPARVTRD